MLRLNSTVTALSPLGRRRGGGSVVAMSSQNRPVEIGLWKIAEDSWLPYRIFASRKCARKSNKLIQGDAIRPCYRVA
jgi:hypothetical protein